MASALSQYLEAISRYPLLDKNQEIILGRRIQRWLNDPDPSPSVARSGKRAQDKMVQCNLRLVVSVCKRYARQAQKSEMLDLIQEGTLGLARGVQKFDPERGYAFSTYAYWWVRQAVSRYIYSCDRTIKLPGGGSEAISKVRTFAYTFFSTHGRQPTIEECADHCNISVRRMRDYLRVQEDCISLDIRSNSGEGNSTLMDFQTEDGDEDMLDRIAFDLGADFIATQLNYLTESERFVVEHYYGIDKKEPISMSKVGKLYGVSRERCRQLHLRALIKLRINSAVPA